MRTFASLIALAVVGGASGRADAQVMGTGGASMPGGGTPMLGYYSPYPGALYSPFRQAPAFAATPYRPGFYNPGYYDPSFGNTLYGPNPFGNGFTVTQFQRPGSYWTPQYPSHSSPGTFYRRW